MYYTLQTTIDRYTPSIGYPFAFDAGDTLTARKQRDRVRVRAPETLTVSRLLESTLLETSLLLTTRSLLCSIWTNLHRQ